MNYQEATAGMTGKTIESPSRILHLLVVILVVPAALCFPAKAIRIPSSQV